jgi:protein-tyrosine phosphatase
VIDLHAHILHGLDDGARTLDESLAMARAAVADGTRVLAATPHVRDDYPTRPAEMEEGVGRLREALAAERLDLHVVTGGEIALDRLPLLDADELARFGLAGNPSYLLVEFPYYGWPLDVETRLFELRAAGLVVVLAHPERNAEVQSSPDRLRRLVEQDAIVQLTAASLDGRLGRASRKTALRLLDLGLAHLVASDAHSPAVRGIGLRSAAEAIGDAALARWLTEDVPAAIVDGDELPHRPPARRSTNLGGFRRRR